MRFTGGCKVEVFSKREVSTGSWRPAEILSGDGHNYAVKYDKFANEPVIGWVSREAIRPCPPLEPTIWVTGDIVEVFDNFSWKVGTILEGLGQKQVLVELHGSLVNLIVSLDEIRVRHTWEDGKWIVMGKQSLNYEDVKYGEMRTGFLHKLKKCSPYRPTELEYSAGASRKYRYVERKGQTYRVLADLSGEHEHMMLSQCNVDGKRSGHSALLIRFPVKPQRSKSSQSVHSYSSARSDSNDEDNDLCSVGSCSSTDSWSQFIHYGPADDGNGDASEAESSSAPSHDEEYITQESLDKADAPTIHQLELQGYRCTLRALYAAGPLSWEKQSLIRNISESCFEFENLLHDDTSPCSKTRQLKLLASVLVTI